MTKKRILVIDDDKDLAQLLKLNLERTDLDEVMIASDGEEGINIFRVNQPHWLLQI